MLLVDKLFSCSLWNLFYSLLNKILVYISLVDQALKIWLAHYITHRITRGQHVFIKIYIDLSVVNHKTKIRDCPHCLSLFIKSL